MTKPTSKKSIDSTTIKRLALDASVDPRTMQRVLAGEPVRGMSGERAKAALIKAGYLTDGVSK